MAILGVSLAAMVGVIAYCSAQYEIEAVKQEAFMMKACLDAGGEWSKTWNNRNQCLRPKQAANQ